jgi:ketosteroid isomerase-like protein
VGSFASRFAKPSLEMRVTHIYTVRNGRIFGMESFWDHDEALKAVGLEE